MRRPLWWWMLICTGSYFLLGELCMLMAVPPGYAVGIWPPAGVALALVLVIGYRLWPAVLLGSFLVNGGALLQADSAAALAQAALAPLLMALGAALQAVAGAALLRRCVGYPLRLDEARSVGLYLLLACGLASVISASFATLALLGTGALALENALFNWLTWWVGDGLGVMIFGVLVFLLIAQPREIWRSRRQALVPILLFTTLAMVALYVLASRWELSRQQAEFERRSSSLQSKLSAELRRYMDGLYSAQALFAASTDVSRQDFSVFAQGILARYPGFQGLAWNPLIHNQAQELALEREISQALGEPRRLFQRRREDLLLQPVDLPLPYVVISYIEPLQTNLAAPGYVLNSAQQPRDALRRAAAQDRPAATGPLRLIQEPGRQRGVVVYLPVFVPASGGSPQLEGYVSGVFRIDDLLHVLFSDAELAALSLQLVTGGDRAAGLLTRLGPPLPADEVLFRDRWHIVFADQRWEVEVAASQQFLVASRSMMPWLLLAVVMLFTGLLGMFFLVLTGQKHRSDEVGEELRMMLKRLNQTQKQLVEAEKLASLGAMVAGFAHELNTPLGVVITAESTLQGDLRALREAIDDEQPRQRIEFLVERLAEASRIGLANAQRAGQMISSFKTVSVDQCTEEIREIQLGAYLQEVLNHYSPNYRNSGHKVVLDCAEDIRIRTVPGGITQVVINILANSLQHGFTDGRSGHIRLSVSTGNGAVQLRIADDGVGIASDAIKKIFDPFYTTRRGAGGTGLGLHLVYNIVRRQLQGSITVISRPGEGATFEIGLPLDVAEPGLGVSPPASPGP